MSEAVIVLNASYEPLHTVTLRHAIRMLVRQVAVVEEVDGTRTFGPFPRPLVLRLVKYVRMAWRYGKGGAAPYSRAGVIRRDRETCAYCGKAGATTIDHVIPRSFGGTSTWSNVVAAHRECNLRKDARTPDEAGMPLRWKPWTPTRADLMFAAARS